MFGTGTTDDESGRNRALCISTALAIAALLATVRVAPSSATSRVDGGLAEFQSRSMTFANANRATTRIVTVRYASHKGVRRSATLILPAWYGPADHAPLPLVISPHGRNRNGASNAEFWGELPARGGFAVVNPDGMGRVLDRNSFGYSGQIDDLSRMPQILSAALPWLQIDAARIYAVGSSMGGQEALLLVARYPTLLAGAVAMDSVTDLARRYRQMPATACDAACLRRHGRPYGPILQQLLAREVGGTPSERPGLYAMRSPMAWVDRIAASGVPLQIWWSAKDRIVTDQAHQSGLLFRTLRRIAPCAAVSAFVGHWPHSREMRETELLPIALVKLGLLQSTKRSLPSSVTHHDAPACTGV
jgi:poly(3-hydroxybutyrate) depolymerase